MKPKIQIVVSVSDPWEFYEDNENNNTFYADVIDFQDDCVLFYSHRPIILRSKTDIKQWHNFIGTSRHAENIINKITTRDGCLCNVIAVANDAVSISEAEYQAKAWRGGGAFIGNIRKL